MKNFMNSKFFSFSILAILAVASTACGSKFTGTYTLTQTQTGSMSPMGNQQNCSTITMAINESGSQITGQGQNSCYTETLSGTTSNGQATVTLNVMPVQQSSYMNSGSSACTYQGTLTISGNNLSGMLMPMQQNGMNYGMNYGCSNSITLSGVKN